MGLTNYQETLLEDCYQLARDLRDTSLTFDESVTTIGNLCDKLGALKDSTAAEMRSNELIATLKDIGSWK